MTAEPRDKLRCHGARVVVLLWVGVTAGACGGGTDVPPPTAIGLVAASDQQTGDVGARLATALAVSVSLADGSPAPRGEVRWAIIEGAGASLSDSVTQADGLGRAEVVLTLGPTPGPYRVRAALRVDPAKSVTFSATAVPGPAVASVSPTTFASGDTVTVLGSGFDDSTAIRIGGMRADRLGTLFPDTIRVAVPPCLAPGTVQVVATRRGVLSNAVSGTYMASGGVNLALGERQTFRPDQIPGCVTFPAAGASAVRYLFVPHSVSPTPSDTLRFELRGNLSPPVATTLGSGAMPVPFATQFHDALRARDAMHALLPKPDVVAFEAPAAPPAVQIGNRRKFRVCRTITCQLLEDFPEVTAEAAYVGTHAIIYRDLQSPEGGLTAGDITTLGRLFDQDLYEVATNAFGAESDIDRNGRTVILMTPVVNGLTPPSQCATSIITGFFFSIDIDPAFSKDQRSNKAEVFYSLAADPAGERGCAVSGSRVRQLVPVTFIHELQHMISYNQHVLLRGGSVERLWLNEGMSHMAEDLAAIHLIALNRGDDAVPFAAGNFFNAYRALAKTNTTPLIFMQSPGTLEERGAAWLFVRWLADIYGPNVLRRMVETGLTGVPNVENVMLETFDRLVPEWMVANYVSHLNGLATAPALWYRTWNFRSGFRELHLSLPSQFPNPYPIVPMVAQGGSFFFTGTLFPGSGHYYIVELQPNQSGFTVEYTKAGGEPFAANGSARLSVVRIP